MALTLLVYLVGWVCGTYVIGTEMGIEDDEKIAGWVFAGILAVVWPALLFWVIAVYLSYRFGR